MRSKFAFFVIFSTIFLLFLLDETLAGGRTSSKHKSDKSESSETKRGRKQPTQIGMGVFEEPFPQIHRASLSGQRESRRFTSKTGSISKEFQRQSDIYDPKDNGSRKSAKGQRGGTSTNCCTIL
ncbi:hypothetical protein niasHS_013873 [Heterodera schachtii]|uniref:Uncharacterized protein n=1 Tax=Heterodera schachtii TaxID=97005 RepID=A0ABD2IPP5_HETSC